MRISLKSTQTPLKLLKRSGRAFARLGGGYRQNELCPFCRSLDRERHIYLYLKNETSFLTGPGSVLHIAPKESLQKKLRSNPNLNYVSGDLASPRAEIQLDVTALPFEDSRFGQFDHLRLYTLNDYSDRLRATGFQVELFNYLKKPQGDPTNPFRLLPGEDLIIGRKPGRLA